MLGTRVVSTYLSQKRLWSGIGIQWYELLVRGMKRHGGCLVLHRWFSSRV